MWNQNRHSVLPLSDHTLLAALQDITKNFTAAQAAAELGQLLQLPWSTATLVTLTENITAQVSRKGKVLVQVTPAKPQQHEQPSSTPSSSSSTAAGSSQASQQQQQQQGVAELFSNTAQQQQQQTQQPLISLQHDRVKATPINGSIADPFLYKIGLQTAEGRIKANMQVNDWVVVCATHNCLRHTYSYGFVTTAILCSLMFARRCWALDGFCSQAQCTLS
jgi:hypothetical protein